MSWAPLILSIQVALVSTLIAGLFGILIGYSLSRRETPARDLIDVVVTAPMILPPTVLGYYVLVVLGRSSPIGQAFEAATGTSIVFTPLGAVVAAVIGVLILHDPFTGWLAVGGSLILAGIVLVGMGIRGQTSSGKSAISGSSLPFDKPGQTP